MIRIALKVKKKGNKLELTEYLSRPFPITLCNVDLSIDAKQIVHFAMNKKKGCTNKNPNKCIEQYL